MHAPLRLILIVAIAILAAGCQTIGPGSLQRDRLNYADAIASSWREQMLLNIVKLRYFDAPVFLEVSSVIGSYTLQGDVSLTSRIFPFSRTDTYHQIGATGTYTDHPTISYTPVTGQKYINSLLRPIPPQAIFAMIQGGHPADYILRLSVQAINGVYNYSMGPARAQREDPAFYRVIEAMRDLQRAGALEIRTEKRADREVTVLGFRENVSPDIDQEVSFVREALGINPESKELMLTFGATRGSGNEITLLTRSMLNILAELSMGVDVPPQDLAEGRAIQPPKLDGKPHAYALLRIYSGHERPPDAWIAGRYRDDWYWVDDRDLESKRVFTFLTVFSSIAETGAVPQVPVITIPAN